MTLDEAPPRCERIGAHLMTNTSRHCVCCGVHCGPLDPLDCPECREKYLSPLSAGPGL